MGYRRLSKERKLYWYSMRTPVEILITMDIFGQTLMGFKCNRELLMKDPPGSLTTMGRTQLLTITQSIASLAENVGEQEQM